MWLFLFGVVTSTNQQDEMQKNVKVAKSLFFFYSN